MTIASLATVIAVFSLAVPAYADNIDLTGSFDAVIHSGADIDKELTVTAAFGDVDALPLMVTHSTTCLDALNNPVITVTPISGEIANFGDSVFFNEKVTAMPGVYSCDVVFTVTDNDGESDTVTQTNDITVIGSHGYWKNHPLTTDEVCDDGGDATSITIGTVVFLDADCDELQDVLEKKGGNIADRYAREAAAAQLNAIATGITPCTEVTDALAAGNALLAAETYAGVGSVGNGEFSKVDREAVNDAKDILDAYNNDSFCEI